jgi:hypothetical protein
MFWQRELYRDSVPMTFSQTYEEDLPKSGFLGSLMLYISSTQNGYPFLASKLWRLIDYITKIEVIADGAEVIKSLDGKEALAAAFYDDLFEADSMWRHYTNTPHRQLIPIHFGRWLRDELYGLDLSRYNQVTLKITNNATSTEFTTDIRLTIVPYWLRDVGGFGAGGHFREEVWKSWAPAAGVVEYNELPVALPIRRILLVARPAVDSTYYKNQSSMGRLMSDIDFTFKTGQIRVYKGPLELLARLNINELRLRPETRGLIDRNAGIGFDVGVGYVEQIVGAPAYDGTPGAFPNCVLDDDVQDSTQALQVRAGGASMAWTARGLAYMHAVPLWFATKPDLSDLLDPEAQKVVKVDTTCATGTTVAGSLAAAANAIILSRLVR